MRQDLAVRASGLREAGGAPLAHARRVPCAPPLEREGRSRAPHVEGERLQGRPSEALPERIICLLGHNPFGGVLQRIADLNSSGTFAVKVELKNDEVPAESDDAGAAKTEQKVSTQAEDAKAALIMRRGRLQRSCIAAT